MGIARLTTRTRAILGCSCSARRWCSPRRWVPRSRPRTRSCRWSPTSPTLAPLTDPDLRNAWGLTSGPTTPWWVSDNGTNKSTLYNAAGVKQGLIVAVAGGPTGTVFNTTAGFILPTGGKALFLFDGEDGIVRAWNGAQGTTAIIVGEGDQSAAGAIYKGLAIADRAERAGALRGRLPQQQDRRVRQQLQAPARTPASSTRPCTSGFAPFNVQVIGNRVFVSYARRTRTRMTRSPGQGRGFVDVYDLVREPARRDRRTRPAERAVGPGDGAGELRHVRAATCSSGTSATAASTRTRSVAEHVRARRQAPRRRQQAARDRRPLGTPVRAGREQRHCGNALLHGRPERRGRRPLRPDPSGLTARSGRRALRVRAAHLFDQVGGANRAGLRLEPP